MLGSCRSSFVAATLAASLMTGACDASSSPTARTQLQPDSIAVSIDRVYLAPDRRTVVVYAASNSSGTCLAADGGTSVSVNDNALTVEVRRVIPSPPPPTCLPICDVAKSTVTLAEPLAENITVARSTAEAATTCSSGPDPTAAIRIEPCIDRGPTPTGQLTTTLPISGNPDPVTPC